MQHKEHISLSEMVFGYFSKSVHASTPNIGANIKKKLFKSIIFGENVIVN